MSERLNLGIYFFDCPRLDRDGESYVNVSGHDLVGKVLSGDLEVLYLIYVTVVELDGVSLSVVVLIYEAVDIEVAYTGFFGRHLVVKVILFYVALHAVAV